MRQGSEREGIRRAEPKGASGGRRLVGEEGASVVQSDPLIATQVWEARNSAVNLGSANGTCWDALEGIQVS